MRELQDAAVRAVPGVKSVMVALTAERAGGAGTPPAAAAAGNAARRPASAPRAPPGRRRPPVFPASRRSLPSPQERAASANRRPPSIWRSDSPLWDTRSAFSTPKSRTVGAALSPFSRAQTVGGSDLKPIERRYGVDVDRLPRRGGDADDLARPDGDVGARQQMPRDVDWGELDVMVVDIPPGTATRNSPWRNRCRSRRGDRLDAAEPRAARRATRHHHVPPRQRAGARHRREHELSSSVPIAARAPTSSVTAARAGGRTRSKCRSWARSRSTSPFAKLLTTAFRWS